MNFEISPDLNKELKKIKDRDKQLAQKIEKQLTLFQQNHFHPSLRVHKLIGNLSNYWSMSVDRNIRMLYMLSDNEAYFFEIGTHNQVYKK
jgi:addiction module RelE/StbE family toxin